MVITISRQPGCRGEEIAEKLANNMGYAYLDSILLKKKLLENQIPELLFDRYDEKKPGYWAHFSKKAEHYLNNLKMVILDFASQGDCVLVGHGTQILFSGIPGVTRVRITAPKSDCIMQVAKDQDCSEKEAEKIVNHINNERKGFYQTFFNTNPESNELYDMTINNQYLAVDKVVDVIRSLVEVKKDLDCSIDDIILKQRVTEDILYKQKIPVYDLNVEVIKGDVILSGSVLVKENIDLCKTAVMNIPGVTNVHTEKIRPPHVNTYGK